MEDNKKSDVEKALEDLFDEPFLTIDQEKQKQKSELKESEKHLYEDGENIVKIAKYSDEVYEDNDLNSVSNEKPFVENSLSNQSKFVSEVAPISSEPLEHTTNYINYDNYEKKDIFEDPYVVDTAVKSTKYGLYAILALILVFIIGTTFIIVRTNQERIVECTFTAKDEGYKITDSYIIAHKNGNLTYIQGEYTYLALNDEYKKQLEYVKEEKLPVIINSNGKKGFTHVLQTTDKYVKIYSYYDITRIDFNEVDKNNNKTTPLSYLDLRSDTTFKKLETKLKKEAYVCKKHN